VLLQKGAVAKNSRALCAQLFTLAPPTGGSVSAPGAVLSQIDGEHVIAGETRTILCHEKRVASRSSVH
jgi:hypothetical protein